MKDKSESSLPHIQHFEDIKQEEEDIQEQNSAHFYDQGLAEKVKLSR
jgi:hypothetical protein